MSRKNENKKIDIESDIRKTVKNKKTKINNKNKNYKVLIVLAIVIAVIAMVIIIANLNGKAKNEEVKEFNYFIFLENNNVGVIDKRGNVIIPAQYEYVQIPNPDKAIFICLFDYNSYEKEYNSKVLNEKGDEIYTKYNKVTAIPNNNTSNDLSYQTNILQYKEGDKFGLITIEGKKITSAEYDSISTLEYKDDVLKITKNNLTGLIDFNGKTIVDAKYNSISTDGYYSENTKYDKAGYIVNIITDEGYRYGYIDGTGKKLLDLKYNEIERINELKLDNDIYLITYENGQAGLFNGAKNIIKNEYESIEYDKVNQILALQKNVKYGVYDLHGNMILPIQYEDILFAGIRINAHKDGELLIFDATGNIQKNPQYLNLTATGDNKYYITVDKSGKYGVVDKDKNVLIENKYSYIDYAMNGYFIITKDEKVGLANNKGDIVLPLEYNVIQKVNNTNILQTINSNNKTEIYNNNIEKVGEGENAHIYIRDNYVEVIIENNLMYLDLNGNIKKASDIFTNNMIFADQKDGKWGYVDKDGKVIVEYKYDMATNINKYGFGAIKENGKWGIIGGTGNIVKEPRYELTVLEPTFIGEFYRASEEYEVPIYSRDIKQSDEDVVE